LFVRQSLIYSIFKAGRQHLKCTTMKTQSFLIAFFIFSFVNIIQAQQLIFQKSYGDTLSEEAHDLKRTFDGGYILAGLTTPATFSDPDAYLVKTDSTGNLEWKKSIGGTEDDKALSIVQNSDSGYTILGFTVQILRVNSDFYILKTDKNGNVTHSLFLGADYEYEYPSQIIQTKNEELVMVGTTEAGLGGNTDFYFTKFTKDFVNQLSNAYGDSAIESIAGVIQCQDNNFVFTGNSSWGGIISTAVVKLDTSGNIIWAKLFNGTINWFMSIGITETSDNGFVIAGRTNSFGTGDHDIYLLKIDSIGSVVWCKIYGGSGDDYPKGFAQTNSGNFILAGVTSSFGSGGGYVFETDSEGNVLWSKLISSVSSLNSVICNPDGSIAIAGSTNSFGAGSFDMLLIQADSTGNFFCNQTAVNTITERVPVNTFNTNLIISSGGEFGSAATIIDSKGVETLICIGTGINELSGNTSRLDVFPNPATQNISFELPTDESFEIKIFNLTGEVMFEQSKSNGKIIIDFRPFADGVYFITATGRNSILNSKLIKQ